ncbi:Protein of unknown function (DUF604) [Abeliophyllum distichum]|uniref:Uncharacterized protein n=1 Tax=Abeliophyllum distichum TaxID=126358 RepID=A0ABD1TVM0_9LAMI
MKVSLNNSEKNLWDPLRSPSPAPISPAGMQNRTLPKLMVWLILFVSATYSVYTLKLLSSSHACNEDIFTRQHNSIKIVSLKNTTINHLQMGMKSEEHTEKTGLQHIVFGIGASAKLWEKRKEYIKLWWKPEMRGIVWLDTRLKNYPNKSESLPELRISADTSRYAYKNKQGTPGLPFGFRGLILNKYDHNQYYYIGSLSESHLQNIYFSYGMAYGGGGFAISYPLAKALEKMQDRCIQRYPGLYGSDDRMQACMAELGVPLTKELGFHQRHSMENTSHSNQSHDSNSSVQAPVLMNNLSPFSMSLTQAASMKLDRDNFLLWKNVIIFL